MGTGASTVRQARPTILSLIDFFMVKRGIPISNGHVLTPLSPHLLISACSSSLVGFKMAFEGVSNGSISAAIVNGCETNLHPGSHSMFGAAGMLSAEGRCKVLDASADGYARSEAVLTHVLLRTAGEVPGSSVVILAAAVNQCGRGSAITAPNGPSQQALMRSALQQCGLDPMDVGTLQLHGTGTPLGDPIEVMINCSRLFRSQRSLIYYRWSWKD